MHWNMSAELVMNPSHLRIAGLVITFMDTWIVSDGTALSYNLRSFVHYSNREKEEATCLLKCVCVCV